MRAGQRSLLVGVVCLACILPEARAQSGVVKSNGLPLPGATVTAMLGERKLTTVTGLDGRYSFDGITPGTWAMQVDLFGFATARKQVEIGAQPVATEWTLELQPSPAQRARAMGRPGMRGPGGFQVVQNQAQNQIDTQLNEAARAQTGPPAGAGPDPSTDTTEAFLVNGSLSRGLQQGDVEMGPPGMDAMRMGRMGVPGQESGAFGQAQDGSQAGAAGPGGPGGGFGGGMRGPGGGFGGRGGGFGGRGGPGGNRAQGGNQRGPNGRRGFGPGGPGPFFGNRANRGQQQIRGMATFTMRNSVFDAAPYSLNGQNAVKPSYDQFRWGLSIGGPLVIKHLVKSPDTFFFINYFGTKADSPFRGVTTVPTDAWRTGDLSGVASTIYDPNTGAPFPGNQIPLNKISPVAAGLLQYIPRPNQPGAVQNYVFVSSYPQNSQNVNLRVNRTLSKKDRLAVAFNVQQRDANAIQTFGFVDDTSGSGWNSDVSWSHTLSARSVNSARVSFNRNTSNTLPFFAYGSDIGAELGILGTSRDPINFGPPSVTFTNFGALTDASPVSVRNQSVAFADGITWSRGSHNASFGGEIRKTQLNTRTDQNSRGSFSFSGLLTSALDANGRAIPGTGFDFADFLLGMPQSASIRYGDATDYFRGTVYSAYAQDDWRIRPNLSFNLGLRYEYFTPQKEKYGRIANLDIAPGFTGVAPVTPTTPGAYSGAFPDYLINPDKNNFSPRLAFAWKPRPKGSLQVRGAYGIYYNEGVYTQIASKMSAQPPFATTNTVTTSLLDPLTIATGLVSAPPGKTILNTFAVDRNYRVPYAQTWSYSLQQGFPGAVIVELGYLGTKGTRLDIQRLPNRAAPGSQLTAEDRRRIGNAVGFTYESAEGNSIYHAMQLRVTRRFRRGLSANGLYTFGKSIDNSSTFGGAGNTVAQDDRNLAAERGLSSFDRRHTLNIGFNIGSPVGTRNGLMQGHPIAMKLLRDWTLNGGIAMSSGAPFTARVLGNQSDVAGTGSVGSGRADATGLPLYTDSGYFNAAAFTVPSSGHFGNAGRNTIIGPGSFSINSSFGRSFALSERRRLEFRVDANNLTNHVNIASIGTVVNANTYGLALAAGQMRTISANVRFRF